MSSTTNTYTEQQIIEGCIAGDRKYQELLYKQLSGKMYGVCMRYASESFQAQDILQEGFIKVFKYIGQFKGTGSFEGWVRRVFVNVALEQLRKKSNMYVVQDAELNLTETCCESALQKLMAEDIMGIVQTLSEGYRTVFNLYVVEGYAHKDIAEMLNISEGTSKSQLARARHILQKKIETMMNIKSKTQLQITNS
jgi:RNA polymerase sigma factor (sigma-70 family)